MMNFRTIESVPDCYKNQQMWDKAVDSCPHALQFAWMLYDSKNVW